MMEPIRTEPPPRAPTLHANTVDGNLASASAYTPLPSPLQTPPPSSPIEEHQPPDMASSFAERVVLAVEKLVATKIESNTSSTSEKAPDEDGMPQAERASKLAYKRVDEAWDDKTYKYKIAESVGPGVKDLDQYIFIIRDRVDRRTQDTTTFIDVKSIELRDILREICHEIRGISLDDGTPSIEQNTLFHVREALKSHHSRAVNDEDTVTKTHLDLLVAYLETTFRKTDEHLSALLAKREITYDLLWALFKPNAEVYTTCMGTDAARCVLFDHCEEKQDMDGSMFMYLQIRYLNSDGKALGEVTTSSKIPLFRGSKRIELLQAYPLEYHPEKEKVTAELIECGRKFISLNGIHHRQYEGKAFFVDDEDEVVQRHVKGRIMVDTISFKEQNTSHPSPRVRKVRPRSSTPGTCDSIDLEYLDPAQLTKDDLLICSPTVLGFCLTSKIFFEFAITNIRDVEWSPSSFADVKVPEQQKTPIWALTKTYLERDQDDGFRDLVQGKGRGINFLLYGTPGTGKTLTAETLAETYKTPLYTVGTLAAISFFPPLTHQIPAGQIGVDPVRVEKVLTSIFKTASRWRAILLLDEADVFLAKRLNDPHQNALVSVFLRELEQFEGILFLTTNKMQSFDEAMISRIHLAVYYEPLKKDARKEVWAFFLKQAMTKGPPDCNESLINDLAQERLNGREIRNAVLIAKSLAQYEDVVVGESHLKDSIALRQQFQRAFQGAGAVENLNSYV